MILYDMVYYNCVQRGIFGVIYIIPYHSTLIYDIHHINYMTKHRKLRYKRYFYDVIEKYYNMIRHEVWC